MKLLENFPFPEPDLAIAIDMEKQKPAKIFEQKNAARWTVLNKYDGIRGLLQYDAHDGHTRVVSRNDKPLGGMNLHEIRLAFERCAEEYPELEEVVVDGEIYWDIPDFDRLSGVVRKQSAHSEDWEQLYYIIFDCYWVSDPELHWYERMNKLSKIMDQCKMEGLTQSRAKGAKSLEMFQWCMFPDGVLPVSQSFFCKYSNSTLKALQKDCSGPVVSTPYPPPSWVIEADEEESSLSKAEYIFSKKEYPDTKVLNCSLAFVQQILNRGSKPKVSTSTLKPKKSKKSGPCDISETLEYALAEAESLDLEGIMVRANYIPYNGGKSGTNLYKLKSFEDAEVLIVGYNEVMSEEHDPLGRPVWICDNGYGETFKCSAPGNHYSQAQQWRDRDDIVGKMLTVKYQPPLSKNNIPRFPKGVAIRDYE